MIRGKVGNGSGGGLTEVWADNGTSSAEPGHEVVVESVAEHDLTCVPQPVLDGAYRERNAVAAALLRFSNWRSWRFEDEAAFGWWIVYAETPEGQVSWHVSEHDIDLFRFVPTALPGNAPAWDGHTSGEKYRRLARLGVADRG